jgi:DNA recombination protein RmuC
METKSREVLGLLRGIQKDYQKVNENMSILGKHINNSYSQFANVQQSFTLIGQKLDSTGKIEDKVLDSN